MECPWCGQDRIVEDPSDRSCRCTNPNCGYYSNNMGEYKNEMYINELKKEIEVLKEKLNNIHK